MNYLSGKAILYITREDDNWLGRPKAFVRGIALTGVQDSEYLHPSEWFNEEMTLIEDYRCPINLLKMEVGETKIISCRYAFRCWQYSDTGEWDSDSEFSNVRTLRKQKPKRDRSPS